MEWDNWPRSTNCHIWPFIFVLSNKQCRNLVVFSLLGDNNSLIGICSDSWWDKVRMTLWTKALRRIWSDFFSLLHLSHREKPLTIYVYASDSDVVEAWKSRTTSGSVVFNDCIMQLGGAFFYSWFPNTGLAIEGLCPGFLVVFIEFVEITKDSVIWRIEEQTWKGPAKSVFNPNLTLVS